MLDIQSHRALSMGEYGVICKSINKGPQAGLLISSELVMHVIQGIVQQVIIMAVSMQIVSRVLDID